MIRTVTINRVSLREPISYAKDHGAVIELQAGCSFAVLTLAELKELHAALGAVIAEKLGEQIAAAPDAEGP